MNLHKKYLISYGKPMEQMENFVKFHIDSVGKADQIKFSPEVAFGNSRPMCDLLYLTSPCEIYEVLK